MYNFLYSDMVKVKTVEDLRGLFSVDAQFVNLDNQYREAYGDEGEIPFDKIVKKNKDLDLEELAYAIAEGLADFDGDFYEYKINSLIVGDELIISYAVNVRETF